jgi:hypothetical protein
MPKPPLTITAFDANGQTTAPHWAASVAGPVITPPVPPDYYLTDLHTSMQTYGPHVTMRAMDIMMSTQDFMDFYPTIKGDAGVKCYLVQHKPKGVPVIHFFKRR